MEETIAQNINVTVGDLKLWVFGYYIFWEVLSH